MNNATDITIVLDRSGSMESIESDTIGGFNSFLKDQQSIPGKATITLHQFDTEHDVVIDAKDIHEAKPLTTATFVPRGGTALFDAIGRAVNSTGSRLAMMLEKDRPSKVVMVIITDGEENSSREFLLSKIKQMIKHQQDVYKWQFVFLGANQDAFTVGSSMGFAAGNSMTYAANSVGVGSVYACSSDNLKAFRSGTKKDMSFTDKDKEAQKKAGA